MYYMMCMIGFEDALCLIEKWIEISQAPRISNLFPISKVHALLYVYERDVGRNFPSS